MSLSREHTVEHIFAKDELAPGGRFVVLTTLSEGLIFSGLRSINAMFIVCEWFTAEKWEQWKQREFNLIYAEPPRHEGSHAVIVLTNDRFEGIERAIELHRKVLSDLYCDEMTQQFKGESLC